MVFNLIKEAIRKVKKQYWLLFGMIFLVTVIFKLLSLLKDGFDSLSTTPFISLIISFAFIVIFILIQGPFQYGYASAFLKVSKLQNTRFGDLFCGFGDNLGKAVGMNLFRSLEIFLWSLLLIIPGIVKSFAYSMSYYILVQDPTVQVSDAIDKSNEMMKNHKSELFVLLLMLIPYYLPAIALYIISSVLYVKSIYPLAPICAYAASLASIAVAPLAHSVTADFYHILKNEYVSTDGVMMDSGI